MYLPQTTKTSQSSLFFLPMGLEKLQNGRNDFRQRLATYFSDGVIKNSDTMKYYKGKINLLE